METKKKVNIPKKDAWRNFAEKLKKLREQEPPKDLVEKLRRKGEKLPKVAASPSRPDRDMEI